MTGRRKITGGVSIAVMGLLALFLLDIASSRMEPPKPMPQPVKETPPVIQKKMTLATVTLPPPPAPQLSPEVRAPSKSMKALKIQPPEPEFKVVPLKPTPSRKKPPEIAIQKPAPALPVEKENGRALLRLLEFGQGPSITISWPSSPKEMSRLYRVFRNCYGMKTALMDA